MTSTKSNTQQSIVDYNGSLNANFMRMGYGEEIHRRNHGNEVYKGNFKNDTYHGYGCYKNNSIYNAKWTYEGAFFSNSKEGYGLLSLPNNITFEGLYQNDRPFGPGVLTRSNGEQDVGLWSSSTIIRLIQPVDCEINELSTAPKHNAIVLNYRKHVEVAPKNKKVQETKRDYCSEDIMPKLFSIYCKDPESFFFDYQQFEQDYFDDIRKIENLIPILSDSDFAQSEGTIQVNNDRLSESPANEFVEDEADISGSNTDWDRLRKRMNLLLAWNNTPIIIDIMTHTFLNRLYEVSIK